MYCKWEFHAYVPPVNTQLFKAVSGPQCDETLDFFEESLASAPRLTSRVALGGHHCRLIDSHQGIPRLHRRSTLWGFSDTTDHEYIYSKR